MLLIKGIQALSTRLTGPVVTIGNFDGVHLGHTQIIQRTIAQARKRGGVAVAYTFNPHPQVALRPETKPPLIGSYEARREWLAETGLDIVIEEPFSREFSTTTSEAFFEDLLLNRLGVQAIVVGYDFAFGKGRQGHLEALGDFCRAHGVELEVVPPVKVSLPTGEEEVVSSSRIRHHLQKGQIDFANLLLGRTFVYRGVVVRGDARGRQIGFPTANLQTVEGLALLPSGVYVTEVNLRDQPTVPPLRAVTNIGTRPTVDDSGRLLIETHILPPPILELDLDLYGREIEVSFNHRLREERKFSDIETLKQQIHQDTINTQNWFKSNRITD